MFLITGGAGFIGSPVIRHIIEHTNDSVVNVLQYYLLQSFFTP